MDNYRIKEQIGQGVLANVYKAENQSVKNKFLVLKKIECLDVLNAQQAFEELVPYRNIEHHHICQIHDIFIDWDEKISTSFLCYLMDYYEEADLMTFLNGYRQRFEALPLTLIQKWLGTLVEAMSYLFKYNLLHRNLKPSSLYVRNNNLNNDINDLSLQIGDFGIYTIMKDARTKTRIGPGAFDYAAPEIIDLQLYDEKSDIWSIGSIMLDACTTGLYDLKEFRSKLLNIRCDEDLLEEILVDISKVYECKPLIDCLRHLLKINRIQRSDYKALLAKEFIKECLELIDSDLIKYRGCEDAGPSDVPIPTENSVEKLISFIKMNINHESRVQEAIMRFADIIDKADDFDFTNELTQQVLIELMQQYTNNVKIQTSILKLADVSLKLTVANAKNSNKTTSTGFLDVKFLQKFIYITVKHTNSKEIQLNAFKVLIELANFDSLSSYLVKYNIIKYILQALDKFDDDALFCAYACKTIWSLAVYDDILKTYENTKCLAIMRNLLLKHHNNEFCVEMICNVVIALSMHERLITDEEMDVDITSAIVIAFRYNINSASVVKSACIAITALINLYEECAFRFIYLPQTSEHDQIDGIALLKEAYDLHKDDSEVVDTICRVFKQLCTYDEMVTELKSLRLNENLLAQIAKRYRDNQDIKSQCDFICKKIESRFALDEAIH